MRRSRTRVAFAVSLFTALLLVPSIALAQAKHTSTQKPKTPKATTTKPKSTTKKTKKPNTTPSRSVHTTTSRTTNTASKATHTTLHRTTQHYYAGRTPKSMTWYRHHNRRHWMYEVRVRSRAWGHPRLHESSVGQDLHGLSQPSPFPALHAPLEQHVGRALS